jgi:predicted porin
MKYPAIAAAVLALASGIAQAQANVQMYGVVDIGLKYDNGSAADGSHLLSVVSGQRSGSRLGFRGSEDLGGGLRAVFTLESGFNADDGSLANGGRLFGRQSWVGLEGGFGAVYLGRQYSATYNTVRAIDPFKNQEAGDIQRVFGYGLGKVDPISRSDNTVTYQTPTMKGLYARAGYKFGENADNFRTNSSKFAEVVYERGPLAVRGSWQDTDGVPLGAPTTQLGAIVAPTGLGASTVRVKDSFIGAVYNFGPMKLHAGAGETRLFAVRETAIRNCLLGTTVPLPAGTLIASWNRLDVRDVAGGVANQYAIGYAYPLSKRTDLYTSANHTSNGSGVRLNTVVQGANAHELRAGIRHTF